MGNIHSVQKALESFGAKTTVSSNPKELRACNKIVLPGVGAFQDALRGLNDSNLIEPIKSHIREGKDFLGICLGMQLLFEKSQEAPHARGLGILSGEVRKFETKPGLKVPHMGWNQLHLKNNGSALLQGIADGAYVYFCHSYYVSCNNQADLAATTDYDIDFASVVSRDNIFGIQFHPEKSQTIGLTILKNFVSL